MNEEEQGLRDRYFRERRLLLAVSVVLLARPLLGIDIGRSADSLGLHFEIRDPERIWWAVWALWLWSFVCCIQQLNSLKPYIKFPIDRRTRTYTALHRRWARAKIFLAVRASFQRQVPRRNRMRYSVGMPTMVVIEATEHAQTGVELRWRAVPEQPRAVGLVDDSAAGHGWIVRSTSDGLSNETGERYHLGTVAIPRPGRGWFWAAAVVWTWATTSFVTDYVAPVLIGLAPLVAAGVEFARHRPPNTAEQHSALPSDFAVPHGAPLPSRNL